MRKTEAFNKHYGQKEVQILVVNLGNAQKQGAS